jgi:hypothetical protein
MRLRPSNRSLVALVALLLAPAAPAAAVTLGFD